MEFIKYQHIERFGNDEVLGGADRVRYMPYETYKVLLDEFGIEYIPPLAVVKNGSYEQFVHQLESNVFLIADGKGVGEGVVRRNKIIKDV